MKQIAENLIYCSVLETKMKWKWVNQWKHQWNTLNYIHWEFGEKRATESILRDDLPSQLFHLCYGSHCCPINGTFFSYWVFSKCCREPLKRFSFNQIIIAHMSPLFQFSPPAWNGRLFTSHELKYSNNQSAAWE